MEGDHRQTASRCQTGNCLLHHPGHRIQLVIHSDANGLEAALCRVLFFPKRGRRHGRSNHIHQLQGSLNRFLLPLSADIRRNLRRIPLFAIFIEDLFQLLIGPAVHHAVSGQAVVMVHPHIQRRIHHIGEAPRPVVQLRGRHAQIQQDPIHERDLQAVKHLIQLIKIGVNQLHAVSKWPQPRSCRLQSHGIPVDSDEGTGGQQRGNPAGMPSSTQSSVHIDSIRTNIQLPDALLQKHGYMMKFAHSPIASRDASSFSGVRFSASKRSNSPASQISAWPALPTIITSRSIPA